MPSLIPLDDFSQRNTASNMPQPAGKRLIPVPAPATQAIKPAAPAPAKRLGKSRTVSWLGETGLEVVGEYKHPGGLTSQVVSYPAPTPQDPGKRIFLATPAPGPGGGPRTSPAGNPQVVEKAPDGTFKKVGSYRPAAPQEQGDAAPAQAAKEQPAAQDIQSLMRNRQTLEQWRARRPEEVAALERDYSTWAEIKDRNPRLALSYGQAAKERYAKLMAELGSPDQFVTQRKQVELGMLNPPQLVMNQGPGGRVSGMQTLRGSDTQGMQASELGPGVGEQAAAMDDARAREAYQRGQVSGNSGVRALQAFGTGVESVAGGAARLLPDVQGWTDDATLNEISRNQQSFSQANAAQAGGAGRVVQGISQSYGVVAPGAALGAVTGGAATGMALTAGLSQYGQAYQQATDAGLRGADREQFATINAAAESLMSLAFTKLLKMPGLEGAFAKAGIGAETAKGVLLKAAKQVGMSGLEELPEEVLTQIAQNVNTRMSGVDAAKKILTGDELFDIAVQSFGAAGGARALGVLPSVPGEISKANVIRGNAKAYVETPTGPADWAKSHPMAAEEIAAAVQEGKPISRAMMEANSLPTMDSVKRSKWAADVHAAVRNQVADAAGLGEAVAATPDAAESQNPIPTEVQRSEEVRVRVDAERASQAAAVRNLGPEYEQRAQAIEAGAEDAAIAQDIERRMAEEESAPFSNSPKPKGPQFVNTTQPIETAAEGSFGNPQVGDEVVDTREVEGKAGKGTRRGRVVSVEGDWATVQPKFGKQYKVPVGRLEVRGRPGTPKAKGLQEQPIGEGEDFVTPMGGSLSQNTVAPQDQQQGADASVPQPNIPQQPAQQQPAAPPQPQAEVPPTQQAEVGEPSPAQTRSLKKPAPSQAPPRTQQLQMVQAAFPGQQLKPHTTKPDAWEVTLRNGKFLTVEFTTDMGPIGREGLRRSLEAQKGRAVTDAELDAAQIRGRWRVSDEAGFAVDGQGLVRLNSTMATSTDAKHEALHAARSLGLFTDAEWNALKAEHAPNAKTEGDAEEAIAYAAQAWSGPKGLLAKIRQFFNGILSSMKVVKPSADTALKRLRSGKVFGREGKTESRGEAAARLSAEIGGDARYAAAFHGSPHTFDKFTTQKMGSGEGAQAYGWGMYFAGKKAVAEHYRDAFSGEMQILVDGQKINDGRQMTYPETVLDYHEGNIDAAIDELEGEIESNKDDAEEARWHADALRVLQDWKDRGAVKRKRLKGKLYHVDLKPEESDYLLWDKPLSEQSEKVRKALEGVSLGKPSPDGFDMGSGTTIRDNRKGQAKPGSRAPWVLASSDGKMFDLSQADVDRMLGDVDNARGENIYSRITANKKSQQAASEYLKSLGIRGIKYLDGTSRSQGEGSHNYVIFDDADVDITAMYSAELAGAEDGSAKDKAAAAKAWREQGTESPWFKRWFGRSKVVDAEGKPLVVYHGTDRDFTEFKNVGGKVSVLFSTYDVKRTGYFFSDNKDTASSFGSKIVPAYLSIKNPADLTKSYGDVDRRLIEDRGYNEKWLRGTQAWEMFDDDAGEQFVQDLKDLGYDGAIIEEPAVEGERGHGIAYVAFSPTQIKSATANTGTFSPDSADIRYSAEPTQAQKERVASLANPGMSPDVRNQIDAERLAMDAPETQPLAEVQRLADAITPGQARAALASGKPITAPEMEAARRLKESITRNALVNRTVANLAESAKVIAQYDLIGTESARAFNIRRDRVETPFQRNQRLLGDELIGAPKSIRDAIKDALRLANEALLKGDKKTAKVERDRATKLSREGARMAEKNRAFLERIGLLPKDGDEAAWNEIFGNDIKSFRLLREASALNQGYGSAIMEYWNSLLLSSPATQARNLLGTPLNYSIEAFIERPILAAARVAIGKQSAGDTLRAAKEWWKGFSLAGAWRHAVDSYMQETSTFDRLFKGDDYGGLLENMDGYYSIRGLKGRVIRGLGWGPLRAADQFWKALIGGMEVGRFAYAQARSELGANAKSEDISNRMAEIMADYHSDAWEKASARSDIATFTEKGSETRHQVKQRVKALRNVVPGAKFIIPFIDTPVNIAAQTIERAPALGALRYAFKMRDNIKNKRPTFDGLGEAAVKQLVSTAALTALLQSGLMSDDDDKYFAIRSGQHADPLKRYTFKWGDTDLSYQGLEPVASLLSLMADWNASQRSGVNPGTVVVGSTIDQIANKPMLQGLGDILQIMNPRDYGTADSKWKTMEANGLNYAKNFGASWVPAIYKQTVKALRPNALNTRIMATDAEGKDKWTLAGKRMLEQAELGWMLERAGFKDAPAAQIDVFGKPKSNVILDGDTLLSNPVTDFMYRLTSPLRTTEQNAHPANELLAAWNRTKPEGAEDYKLSAVEPRYTDDKGKAAVMDEHQFEQLQRLAGGIADKLYAKGKFDPKNPTEAQVAMLTERLLPAAKEEARKLVVDSIVTGKPVAETIDQIADRLDKKVRVSVFQAASEKVKRTLNKGEKDWQRDRRVEKSLKKRGIAQEQRDKLREGG